ncbi:MAG: 50S ribosome-binding GTPase [Actinomycetaceae bacterium]|nr:50S ribosome-binding GTPase [Actinomycetaceae bacterium]
MKRRTPAQKLSRQFDALRDVVETWQNEDALPVLATDSTFSTLKRLETHIKKRRELNPGVTVVAIMGPTGSGKSTLFNSLIGSEIAKTGVRRPTTSTAMAALNETTEASDILDWLQISSRAIVPTGDLPGGLPRNLVLVDCPDIDSVEESHLQQVERLSAMVDVLLWVVDPQKYADAVLYDSFLQHMSAHGEVTVIALSHCDTLEPEELTKITHHLDHLLEQRGLEDVTVFPVSGRKDIGITELGEKIVDIATKREASHSRLSADLSSAAAVIRKACDLGELHEMKDLSGWSSAVVVAAAGACGVPVVAESVARAYSQRANTWVGWPLTRWLAGLKPDPLKRLHLGQLPPQADTTAEDPQIHVDEPTSLDLPSTTQSAVLSRAGVAFTQAISQGLPQSWERALTNKSRKLIDPLRDALDKALGQTVISTPQRPWWWRAWSVLQWGALAAALIGVLWFAVLKVAQFFYFELPVTYVGPIPAPIALIAVGLLAGLLLSLIGRALGRALGQRHANKTTRKLYEVVTAVTKSVYLEPMQRTRMAHDHMVEATRQLEA